MVADILDRETFCRRFREHMLQLVAPRSAFDDGDSIADYADMTAPTYWEEQHQEGDSPEACAEADISYWGE